MLSLLPGYACSYLGKLSIYFRQVVILLNLLSLTPFTQSSICSVFQFRRVVFLRISLVTVSLTSASLLVSYEYPGSMKDIDFSPTFSLIVVLVELFLVLHHEA